jgi:hypothetical protein
VNNSIFSIEFVIDYLRRGYANEPSAIELWQEQRIESSNLTTKSTKIISIDRWARKQIHTHLRLRRSI